MSAPNFEFVVEGPAVPLRAAKKNAKRYQRWRLTVRDEAVKRWQPEMRHVLHEVSVTITNYYTEPPPDIDNIIKPILDALNGLVYADDVQVQSVTSRKIELDTAQVTTSSVLAEALQQFTEVIHVEVFWEAIL